MNESNISSKSKELISWLRLPQDNALLKNLRLDIKIKIKIEFCFSLIYLIILLTFYKNYLWIFIVEVSAEEFHWPSHYFMIQKS